jgi:hypothetical protein
LQPEIVINLTIQPCGVVLGDGERVHMCVCLCTCVYVCPCMQRMAFAYSALKWVHCLLLSITSPSEALPDDGLRDEPIAI